MSVVLALVVAAAATTTAPLEEAERAFEAGRYELVLPLVEEALAGPSMPTSDRVRAYALSALVQSALDHPTEAIAAYEKALETDPTFTPGTDVSPRVRSLFEEAKRSVARRRAAFTPPPPPETHAAARETSLLKKPWVWAVVGAVIVGGAVATGFALAPALPRGDVPNGTLR